MNMLTFTAKLGEFTSCAFLNKFDVDDSNGAFHRDEQQKNVIHPVSSNTNLSTKHLFTLKSQDPLQ